MTRASELQQNNEETCRIFGHLPEPVKKPAAFGELSNTLKMKCARCNKAI